MRGGDPELAGAAKEPVPVICHLCLLQYYSCSFNALGFAKLQLNHMVYYLLWISSYFKQFIFHFFCFTSHRWFIIVLKLQLYPIGYMFRLQLDLIHYNNLMVTYVIFPFGIQTLTIAWNLLDSSVITTFCLCKFFACDPVVSYKFQIF